ncbi:MAG: LSM domain-containing protein [Promethearchaeota archaeon]
MSRQEWLQEQLRNGMGKRIFIKLRNRNYELAGILREFDQHLNLVLEDAQEIPRPRRDGRQAGEPVQYGEIIVRGDSIVLISY